MQKKALFAFISLLVAVTLYNTWALKQIHSFKQSDSTSDVRESPKSGRSDVVTPKVEVIKAEPKLKTAVLRIPIYTSAAKDGAVFTTFTRREELLISHKDGEWAEVIATTGFPVWVRQDMVEKFNNGYVKVVVHRSNARSSLGIGNSIVMGKLTAGDILKVSQRRDGWVRIWSPIRFKAWVKLSDLET